MNRKMTHQYELSSITAVKLDDFRHAASVQHVQVCIATGLLEKHASVRTTVVKDAMEHKVSVENNRKVQH